MVMKIPNLAILQMMLNWEIECQKSGLWREGQRYGWTFASESEGSRGQNIRSHRKVFEEVRCVTHGSLSHSIEARNSDEIIQERSVHSLVLNEVNAHGEDPHSS